VAVPDHLGRFAGNHWLIPDVKRRGQPAPGGSDPGGRLTLDSSDSPLKRHRITLLLLSLALSLGASSSAGAQNTDVIRGRVTGPDSLPVRSAQVTVTSVSGNVSRGAVSNQDGRFTVTFPGGDGDYIVNVTAIGFAPRRFQLKRVADEDVLIADARLSRVEVLDEVRVVGQRERVRRGDVPPDIGGTEHPIQADVAVPASDLGDLAAMAATLPGVQLVPGEGGDPNGFSVLGLGADQNMTTLNGLSFGGASLPRDAATMSSLATSPYDVSRGGFSGAQFSIRGRPGTNFRIRGASLNLETPQTQWTDRAAADLGQENTNLSLGGIASGPIRMDRSFYSVSYQLGRRINDLQSLFHTSPLGLRTSGVAADSAARLGGILTAAQIPTSVAGLPSHRTMDQGSLFGSLDFNAPNSTSGHSFNVSFNGNWNRQNPASLSATEMPSHGAERTSVRGGLQARHSGYLFSTLSETSVGLSGSRTEAEPYLALPAGRVRVSSEFGDGGTSVQTLSFGGNQNLASLQSSRDLQFLNQLSWFSRNDKHRLKFTTELRDEASSQSRSNNVLGTFLYNSLADLENSQAVSYSRQLLPRERSSRQLVSSFSLGDSWRRTQNLQIQYGARVDANRFATRPAFNSQIADAFGVRNDFVPNRVYVSPRIGFSWTYGTAAQVAGFEGAQRGPRSVVRGGIGVFQNTPGPGLIGAALENTGLAGSAQQLLCVGSATPTPDWAAYAEDAGSVPSVCADGSAGSVFSDATPSVALISRDYRAPRSLRSNLQWSQPILDNRFSLQLEGTYSRNTQQSGTVDLNFNPLQRFALPAEGDRPVYVTPASIVPGTGAVAPGESRVSPLFSRVSAVRSDLSSTSRQLSARLSPVTFRPNFSWSLSYVLADVRESAFGFTSTGGNPLAIERSPSSFASRHQITYNLSYNLFDWVRLNWFGSFRSGSAFTPTVASDINGDGYANDRAFVFDPQAVSDAGVAEGMRNLLDNGSDAARECLSRQIGAIAGRNSCRGPWSSSAVLSFALNPVKLRIPQRATLSFQLSNPLGAADLLLHGSDDLRGWGQTPFPDQALLYVRGFDPQTQRFRYEVNQRFGATNPAFSTFRAPVTLTAMMRFDLGPVRERQLLAQQLERGRRATGGRLPEQMLRAMFAGGGGLPNPLAVILRQQDSLALSSTQADSVATLNRRYTIRLDSIWAPVASYIAALSEEYDEDEVWYRYRNARRATVDLLIESAPVVKGLLRDDQVRKLPAMIVSHLDSRYLTSIRSGTATYAGGGMIPPGAQSGGGGQMMPATGGGNVIIIRQ
jgi:hypothetical protein